jgi:hypothetical protein
VRHSAIREGFNARQLRDSVKAFSENWELESDGRIRHSQLAALKHKGLTNSNKLD